MGQNKSISPFPFASLLSSTSLGYRYHQQALAFPPGTHREIYVDPLLGHSRLSVDVRLRDNSGQSVTSALAATRTAAAACT